MIKEHNFGCILNNNKYSIKTTTYDYLLEGQLVTKIVETTILDEEGDVVKWDHPDYVTLYDEAMHMTYGSYE